MHEVHELPKSSRDFSQPCVAKTQERKFIEKSNTVPNCQRKEWFSTQFPQHSSVLLAKMLGLQVLQMEFNQKLDLLQCCNLKSLGLLLEVASFRRSADFTFCFSVLCHCVCLQLQTASWRVHSLLCVPFSMSFCTSQARNDLFSDNFHTVMIEPFVHIIVLVTVVFMQQSSLRTTKTLLSGNCWVTARSSSKRKTTFTATSSFFQLVASCTLHTPFCQRTCKSMLSSSSDMFLCSQHSEATTIQGFLLNRSQPSRFFFFQSISSSWSFLLHLNSFLCSQPVFQIQKMFMCFPALLMLWCCSMLHTPVFLNSVILCSKTTLLIKAMLQHLAQVGGAIANQTIFHVCPMAMLEVGGSKKLVLWCVV